MNRCGFTNQVKKIRMGLTMGIPAMGAVSSGNNGADHIGREIIRGKRGGIGVSTRPMGGSSKSNILTPPKYI